MPPSLPAKKRARSGTQGPSTLLRFDGQDLPALVITARGAGRMRGDRAPALRAFIELRRLPAVRRLARAQAHLRSFTFGNSHKGKQESRKSGKHNGEASNQGSFSLSSTLQSGRRLSASGGAASASACFSAGQIRPPSRSQCGWGGKFSRISSRR